MKALIGLMMVCNMAAGVLAQNKVLEVVNGYANGGGYNAAWNSGSGSPEEIVFGGQKILSKGTNGTYCSGFTFAVVMRVATQQGLLKEKTVEQIRTFQKEWYGLTASAKEKQCATAVENLGIGTATSLTNAKAGDFVQFWRNNETGHSAVFLGWEMQAGKPVSIKYRSSQGSTGGIGPATEKIGDGPLQVNAQRIYLVRLKSS